MTHWPGFLPAFLFLLAADARPQGAADFDDGMADVRRRIERGSWSRAREALVALIDEHGEAPYVLMQRGAIIDDLKRCVFYESYRAPKVKDLISGELLSYSDSSGKVKLRYGRGNLDDFIRPDSKRAKHWLLHPLTFEGAYSVEIEFDPYPTDAQTPYVIIGYDTEKPAQIIWGRKKAGRGSYVSWVPARIRLPSSPTM